MTLRFSNNAAAELAVGITALDSSITLAVGQGAAFPAIPAGDYAVVVLQDGNVFEVVHATGKSGDVLTVERGKEGTSPSNFPSGTVVEMRVTAGVLSTMESRIVELMKGYVPLGGIVMYDGPAGAWGTSWALCDGTMGTPNLSDRFIMASGPGHDAGTAGGATPNTVRNTGAGGAHNHTGSTGGTAITVDQMPSHNHAGSTSEAGAHTHSGGGTALGVGGTGLGSGATVFVAFQSYSVGSGGLHTHTLVINNAGGGQAHTHTIPEASTHTHTDPDPPFYVLAFIKRIA